MMTDDVKAYADAYLETLASEPHRTSAVLAARFGVSRATVIRRLQAARDRGLLPVLGEHRPATARWANSLAMGPSWLACMGCHQPWPCTSFKDANARGEVVA